MRARLLVAWSRYILLLVLLACVLLAAEWDYAMATWLASFFVLIHLLLLVFTPTGNIHEVVHYSAIYVYFFLAPAMQAHRYTNFWGYPRPPTEAFTAAFLLVVLYMVGFEISRFFVSKQGAIRNILWRPVLIFPRFLIVVLTLTAAACCILFIFRGFALQARGELYIAGDVSPMLGIFFATLPKSMVLSSAVITVYMSFRFRSIQITLLMFFILFLSAFFVNPSHTARQHIFIAVIACIIVAFKSRMAVKLTVSVLCVVGLTIVGPLLNTFSRDRYNGVETLVFPESPDYDALFNSAALGDLFAQAPFGFGRYLLNAFSFPLPAALKLFPKFDPLLTRSVSQNFDQTNIALPPFMTAYLDFGYFGSLLMGVCVGGLMSLAARLCDKKGSLLSAGKVMVGATIIGCYIPLVRGPIQGMGPFAFTMIFCAIVFWVTTKYLAITLLPPLAPRPLAGSIDRSRQANNMDAVQKWH